MSPGVIQVDFYSDGVTVESLPDGRKFVLRNIWTKNSKGQDQSHRDVSVIPAGGNEPQPSSEKAWRSATKRWRYSRQAGTDHSEPFSPSEGA